jgi:hypothetical protein
VRDEALVVSPELALVDAELREKALALLPELRPFQYLEQLREPASLPPEWFYVEPVFEDRAPGPRPKLAVAASAYLAAAILRTVAFNLLVFGCVALLVLVLNLAG